MRPGTRSHASSALRTVAGGVTNGVTGQGDAVGEIVASDRGANTMRVLWCTIEPCCGRKAGRCPARPFHG